LRSEEEETFPKKYDFSQIADFQLKCKFYGLGISKRFLVTMEGKMIIG
jgi:hypothetical protein